MTALATVLIVTPATAFELRDLLVNPFNVEPPAIVPHSSVEDPKDLVRFMNEVRRTSRSDTANSSGLPEGYECATPAAGKRLLLLPDQTAALIGERAAESVGSC